jgi:hypothetical protein
LISDIKRRIQSEDGAGIAVGIATGYGLGGGGVGVRVLVRAGFFFPPRLPDQFWGPPSLVSNGHRGLFPGSKAARGVKLTTHLQLVLRSRILGSTYPFLIRIHGVVLNQLSIGTTLLFT